jgi:hypothetical protein
MSRAKKKSVPRRDGSFNPEPRLRVQIRGVGPEEDSAEVKSGYLTRLTQADPGRRPSSLTWTATAT